MKALPKFLLVVAAAIAISVVALYWVIFLKPFAKLREFSRAYDPATMSLKSDKHDFISSAITPEKIQVGLVKLSDGALVKFWFLSHHVNNGVSLAIFRFPDGSEETMEGYFCCGLEFGENKPLTVDELRSFIRKSDGAPV